MSVPEACSILFLRLPGPGDGGGGRAARGALGEFCRRTTPTWELTAQGACLDLTGTGRLYGRGLDGAFNVCRLARDVGRIRAAGVAPSRLAAQLASLAADRIGGGVLAVARGQVAAFLQPFPVEYLPGPPLVVSRFRQMGVRTFGDLQVLPANLLETVFGAVGLLLADEARGRAAAGPWPGRGADRADVAGLTLVAGVRLARPVPPRRMGSALCRGLAVRALTVCPGGPASRGRWRLTIAWSEGRHDSASVAGPQASGWRAWLGLVEMLWKRIPSRRVGVRGVELRAEPAGFPAPTQGRLFPADQADQRLAAVLRRLRRSPGLRLGPASEDLLASCGAVWYGPDDGPPKRGQGFVDGQGPTR